MNRRYNAGDTFQFGGFNLRVVEGCKPRRSDGELGHDLRLDFQTNTGSWAPVPMAAVALIVDFMHENENHLYPPDRGFMGGAKFRQYVIAAMELGVVRVETELRHERQCMKPLPPPQPRLFDIQ